MLKLLKLLSKLFPPKFPNAADALTVMNAKDVRKGFQELPDWPHQTLGELREWSGGRYRVLGTLRT